MRKHPSQPREALHSSALAGRTSSRAPLLVGALLVAAAVAFVAPPLARVLALPTAVVSFVLAAAVLGAAAYAIGRRLDVLAQGALEDPMTRIGNRRHWEHSLAAEVERANCSRMPLSLLVVDVDNLKTLNDAHGHGCGDRALELVADVLRHSCRSRDVAARIGGDEFAVLMPRTRAAEAQSLAERIRAELAKRRASLGAPFDALVTVSIGIADLSSVRDARAELLFECADQALYAAKAKGRDRIEVKGPLLASGIICLDAHRAKKNGRVSA